MMRAIFKYILFILFFLFAVIAFLPKEELYYFAAQKLKEEKIDFSHTMVQDKLYGIDIEDLHIFYSDIDLVEIEKLELDLFLFYNHLVINKVQLDNTAAKFAPKGLKDINVIYSVFDPLNININGRFNGGTLEGNINLLTRTLMLDISASKSFKKSYRNIVKQLKYNKESSTKQEDHYSYEYKLQ